MPGVGKTIAQTLIAELPELGSLDPRLLFRRAAPPPLNRRDNLNLVDLPSHSDMQTRGSYPRGTPCLLRGRFIRRPEGPGGSKMRRHALGKLDAEARMSAALGSARYQLAALRAAGQRVVAGAGIDRLRREIGPCHTIADRRAP